MCPYGMLRLPLWQEVVSLAFAARISPLAGWPDAFSAWAYDCMLELEAATRREDARRIKAAGDQGDGPSFSGRTSSRGRDGRD